MEGLSKPELAALVGEEQVQLWRAGLVDRPPSMTEEHPFWHRGERKYKNIPAHQLPLTESLQDTLDRTVPIWHENIFPDLKAGRNVMIVAHHNSLRAIVKEIDKLDTPDVQKLAIPCCIPLVYKFDQNMKPVSQSKAVPPLSGEYLEKRGLLKEALAKEEELAQKIEGYKEVLLKYATDAKLPHSASLATIKSLSKLEEQRKLLNQLFLEDSGVSVKQSVASSSQTAPSSSSSSSSSPSITTPPINGASSSKSSSPSISSLSSSGQPLLVIIRHGKTEHNKLGLFTGWEVSKVLNYPRMHHIVINFFLPNIIILIHYDNFVTYRMLHWL